MALVAGQIPVSGYQIPDYSGAAAAGGAAAAAPYQMMSGLIGEAKDYFKQQSEAKKSAQYGIKIAEAAKVMDPMQAPYYDQLINSMKDEDTPVSVRGALGASIQDILKQNISSRAVAVQEAQMNMRPAYFGGGSQMPARSAYGASAISRDASMGGGGSKLGIPAGGDLLPLPKDQLVLPGEAGADVMSIEQKIEQAQKLGIPADIVNSIITGIQSALENPSESTQKTVDAYSSNLSTIIENAAKNLEPSKDAQGKPIVVISEDESGNVSRFTRTKGGNLVNEYGEVLDKNGNPIDQPQYKKIDPKIINQTWDTLPGVLPDLPPEASRTKPPTFQELTAVPPIPEGGVQRIGEQGSQPAEVTPEGTQQYSPLAQREIAKRRQAMADEYKSITELSPRKAKLYESALNQAYQDVATAPSENVVKEMELQLLMQPESKGPQVMSEEEYNRRNISTINRAKVRARDRAAMYKILERFDVIQQLANHPDASKIFGQSIPEEKLKELARTEGGVYALYDNLKGQDLVQAMRDIKEQSGTAAQMSERETFALQAAVSDFSLKQDWKSAQKSLMKMANTVIRAGKNLGADDSIFDTSPMTPATYDASGRKLTEASKRQTSKANEILNSPQTLPLFKDEIMYFNRVNELQKRLQTSQGAGTKPTQNAPIQQSVGPDAVRSNLDILFDLNR
jgi:hypothetical protein